MSPLRCASPRRHSWRRWFTHARTVSPGCGRAFAPRELRFVMSEAAESPELRAAIIQDSVTQQVLMLGWMDEEALRRTVDSGEVHFWSRSRRQLWRKGETSGRDRKS